MKKGLQTKHMLVLFFILLVVVLPVFLRTNFYLSMLVVIGIFTVAATGLGLLFGFGGQISLGHAAFFGIGAYTSAVLTKTYSFDPMGALFIGVIIAAIMAALLSIPASRLEGLSVALVTLGFNMIIYILLREIWQVTGGPSGIVGIPSLRLGAWVIRSELAYYYATWTVVGLGLIYAFNLIHSRVGLTLKAMNSSEIAAEALGVHTIKFKREVLIISAIYASVAGSLYAHYLTAINPAAFAVTMSFEFVLMVVLGGIGTVWGGLVGAVSIYAVTEVLRQFVPMIFPRVSGEVEMLFLGIILVLILLFVPEGIVGKLAATNRRRHATSLVSLLKEGKGLGG